jgi:radical SAM protein with 4Fe4S-binding SPASM domain
MISVILQKISTTSKQIKRNFVSFFYQRQIEDELLKKFLGLNIETVNICNANCTFCAYQYQTRENGVMDMDLYKKIIREYDEIGGGDLGLGPTVGDPLVDKYIIERVKFARSFNKINNIGFFSNLISLKRFDLKEFVNSGLTNLVISTSGFDKDMYLRVYRSKMYEKMFNNLIELLKENKINGNPIDIIVEMRTDKSLKETLNFPDYKKLLQYLPSNKILCKFRYDDWAGKIKSSELTGEMKIRNMMLSMRFRYSPCFEYFNGPSIYWNGDVGICGCRDVDAKELIIGNIKTDKMINIWYNKKHLNLLNNFTKKPPEICKVCSHYDNISSLNTPEWKNKIKKAPKIIN